MYEPRWGRFISPDEFVEGFTSQGLNAYAYVGNKPTYRIDPSGNFEIPDLSGLTGMTSDGGYPPIGEWTFNNTPPHDPNIDPTDGEERDLKDWSKPDDPPPDLHLAIKEANYASDGSGMFRPEGHEPAAGRVGNPIVSPGKGIGGLIDDRFPAGHTFAVNHDKAVGWLVRSGVPDVLANIPTMLPIYAASLLQEIGNSTVGAFNSVFGTRFSAPFPHTDPMGRPPAGVGRP